MPSKAIKQKAVKQGENRGLGRRPPLGKRFEPGKSGNPKGRPKKLPAIDKIIAEVLGCIDDKKSEAQAILEALKKRAKNGDVRAAEVLLDRAYGRAKQTIDANIITEQPFFPE